MSKTRTFGTIFIVLLAVYAILWAGLGINFAVNVYPEYQKNVHGHIENAYYAMEPELIIEELTAARNGMLSLGLNESDYGGYFEFEKTPDWSMHYQYQLIDSVIGRAQNIIDWRVNNTNATTQMGDVYQQKISSLKTFINNDEGWMDDIAEATWMCKSHTFYHFAWVWALLMAIPVLGFCAAWLYRWMKDD